MKRHILGLTAAMIGLAASRETAIESVSKLSKTVDWSRAEVFHDGWNALKLGRRKNRVSQASLKRAAKKRNNVRRRSAK